MRVWTALALSVSAAGAWLLYLRRRSRPPGLAEAAMTPSTIELMTHELRQPLASALTNAQAMQRMLRSDGRTAPAELTAAVNDIIDAIRQAEAIVGHTRSVVRNTGEEMRPLDLNEIVGHTIRLLAPAAAAAGVRLLTDLDPRLPVVQGDAVQLQQMATNLVLNAVEATRDHGTPAAAVRVATSAGRSHAVLTVEDAGGGVDEWARARVFEPYYTTKPAGRGVGLSISRSIAERHHGSIDIENLPSGGARFSVALPLNGR